MASGKKGARSNTSSGKNKPASSKKATSKTKKKRPLRRLDEAFREWRFEPAVGAAQYLAVVLLSLGSVALGAALYAALWATAPHGPGAYAAYIFAVGALLLAAGLMANQPAARPLRVGLFGVGFEQDGKTTRMRWYEVDRVAFTHQALQLHGAAKPITLPLKVHGPAVRRILAEAQRRIPSRLEIDDTDITTIGKVRSGEGTQVPAEPPQVTTERCRASDQPLTFEEDVRLCGRCGVPYHKQHVPRRCRSCDRKLQ